MALVARNVYIAPTTPFTLSRLELIQWVNDCTQSNVAKVEDLCSGVHYCMIFQNMFPGTVAMSKVKTDPKLEVHRIDNMRVLQQAFNKCQVDKQIPIDRLVKGRLQDNLEFLQWFKLFCDANYGGQENVGPSAVSAPAPSAPVSKKTSTVQPARRMVPDSLPGRSHSRSESSPASNSAAMAAANQQIQELSEQLNAAKAELMEKDTLSANLEKERDFYFQKLLDIETLCQREEFAGLPLVSQLTEILYATEEGYAAPPENDEEQTF